MVLDVDELKTTVFQIPSSYVMKLYDKMNINLFDQPFQIPSHYVLNVNGILNTTLACEIVEFLGVNLEIILIALIILKILLGNSGEDFFLSLSYRILNYPGDFADFNGEFWIFFFVLVFQISL